MQRPPQLQGAYRSSAPRTVQDPDPQNLDEEDWELRLGGVARLGSDHEAWAKKASRAREKARR